MSRQRFFVLLIAALLAISAALYLSAQRNVQTDLHGAVLLPALPSELATVSEVQLRRGSAAATVTLHQQAGRWTVAERADYPADVPKLRKLLLALNDAKIVEEKTSNPASFATIGVDDPKTSGALGAEVSVTAQDGKHALIVGKPVGQGNFVRRGGENTAYSVEPGISFETEPRFWIDPHLPDIAVANSQSLQVKPAAGPGYTVRKEATGSTFALDGVPVGRKAADAALLAPVASSFSALSADDVAPAASVDFSKADLATLTQTDGSVITITGAVSGDKHWIELQSSKDAAFNAKTSGHAFEIAAYRFEAIFRPLEQLLVPKPAPPAPANPATKKPGPAPKS